MLFCYREGRPRQTQEQLVAAVSLWKMLEGCSVLTVLMSALYFDSVCRVWDLHHRMKL